MYKKALSTAFNAHKGQIRRDSNVPYIVHPIRVSNCFNDMTRKTIAILHDVVEDTNVTLYDLSKDFPSIIIEAVDALSRREDEQHFDYIRRVSKNELAVEIKIVDIVDNLSDTISVPPSSMIDRYNKSLEILINSIK